MSSTILMAYMNLNIFWWRKWTTQAQNVGKTEIVFRKSGKKNANRQTLMENLNLFP